MGKTKTSEPSEEYARFEKLAKQLISVPKSELNKREAEYQRQKKAGKTTLPAINMAGNAKYGLQLGSGVLNSNRLAFSLVEYIGIRTQALRFLAE